MVLPAPNFKEQERNAARSCDPGTRTPTAPIRIPFANTLRPDVNSVVRWIRALGLPIARQEALTQVKGNHAPSSTIDVSDGMNRSTLGHAEIVLGGDVGSDQPGTKDNKLERTRELRSFLFLVIVLLPAISIAIVGAIGLGIWIAHMLGAPPGPTV